MRGFPPLHLLFFILAFGVFSIPLVHLTMGQNTSASAVTKEAVPEPENSKISGYLRVKFAHLPQSVKLEWQGQTYLSTADLGGESSAEKEISLPAEPKEFEGLLQVEWPEGTPETAVTLEWEPEGHDAVKSTLWSEGSLEEVVNLAWK